MARGTVDFLLVSLFRIKILLLHFFVKINLKVDLLHEHSSHCIGLSKNPEACLGAGIITLIIIAEIIIIFTQTLPLVLALLPTNPTQFRVAPVHPLGSVVG